MAGVDENNREYYYDYNTFLQYFQKIFFGGNKNGVIIPTFSEDVYANKLKMLIYNPALRAKLAENAKISSEKL